jgi:hypothetical protein
MGAGLEERWRDVPGWRCGPTIEIEVKFTY